MSSVRYRVACWPAGGSARYRSHHPRRNVAAAAAVVAAAVDPRGRPPAIQTAFSWSCRGQYATKVALKV